jgi:hypothetical protein
LMAVVWLRVSFIVCSWRGGPGMLGVATVVMLIVGGCPETFVCRASAVFVEGGPPGWDGCSGGEPRSCCARAGRLGSLRQPHGRCQMEVSAPVEVRNIGSSGPVGGSDVAVVHVATARVCASRLRCALIERAESAFDVRARPVGETWVGRGHLRLCVVIGVGICYGAS